MILLNKQNIKKRFINIIVVILSIIIVVLLSIFLLDTTGKINQGSFRLNDFVITSTVVVDDKREENTIENNASEIKEEPMNNLSDLRLNITQKNELIFLVAESEGVEIKEIYIDNLKINYPVLTEEMYIYQNQETRVNLKDENIKLKLSKEDKEGQYLIKFNIDNINCIKEAIIPETETSIVFDGTIFNIINVKNSDIYFNIEFNLNIYDSKDILNICKVKLDLPNELLTINGVSIINEDVGRFPFRIK